MSITVKRDDLHAALRSVERAAARRENVPVLNGILLDTRNPGGLVITATDLELGIRARLECTGDGDWARVVDAKLLVGLVSRLSGETVSIEPTDAQVRIASGGARFALASMGPEDFPALPDVAALATVRMPAGILAGALRRVIIAAAQSDQRPVLASVYVEAAKDSLTLTATEGSRLAMETVALERPAVIATGEEGVTALIPAKAALEVVRILDDLAHGAEMELAVGEKIVRIGAAPYTVTTRMIEGRFPPYRNAIAVDLPHRVEFERRPMLDAVNRLSVLAQRGHAVIRFEPGDKPGQVQLVCVEADVGEGVETLRVVGASWPDGLRATYQARCLTNFLGVVESEVVTYAVGDPRMQAHWWVEGSTYRYVVMPVRMEDAGAGVWAA